MSILYGSKNQNHLEDLLKHRLQDPTPRVFESVRLGTCISNIFVGDVLLLLVLGPRSEYSISPYLPYI